MKRNSCNGAENLPGGGKPPATRAAWPWVLALACASAAVLWLAIGPAGPARRQPPPTLPSAPADGPSPPGESPYAADGTGSGAQPAAPLPVSPAQESDEAHALPDEPLERAHRVRALLAGAASAADLDAAGLTDAVLGYLKAGREQDAFDVLMEIAQTGEPWAMDYLSQLAQRLRGMAAEARANVAGGGGDAAEQARAEEWRRLARACRVPVAALLAGDTPAARETLRSLLERARTTGDLDEIAYLAAESGTNLGAELWRDAFAQMTPEARADWVRGIAPMPPSLGGSGVADAVIRGGLADPDAGVRDACVDTLLAERMVQHPGASQWAAELLTDAFNAGDGSDQYALVDAVQRTLLAGAESAGGEVGNIEAMEAVLELGRQSTNPEVQRRTAEVDAWIRQGADVEGIRASAEQDALWIRQLCSTAP